MSLYFLIIKPQSAEKIAAPGLLAITVARFVIRIICVWAHLPAAPGLIPHGQVGQFAQAAVVAAGLEEMVLMMDFVILEKTRLVAAMKAGFHVSVCLMEQSLY